MPLTYEPGENGIECRYANGVTLFLDFLKTPFGDRAPNWNTKLGTCPVKFVGAEGWVETGDAGGTDNHLFLVDLRGNFPDLTAKKAQETLDLAHITCNKNTVPFETRSPFQASGIRLGTPAVTTRGLVEKDMEEIAASIDLVLKAIGSDREAAAVAEAKQQVVALTGRYPLPYKL